MIKNTENTTLPNALDVTAERNLNALPNTTYAVTASARRNTTPSKIIRVMMNRHSENGLRGTGASNASSSIFLTPPRVVSPFAFAFAFSGAGVGGFRLALSVSAARASLSRIAVVTTHRRWATSRDADARSRAHVASAPRAATARDGIARDGVAKRAPPDDVTIIDPRRRARAAHARAAAAVDAAGRRGGIVVVIGASVRVDARIARAVADVRSSARRCVRRCDVRRAATMRRATRA